MIREGEEIALITIGHIGNNASKAIDQLINEGISPALYDMRFLKPIDSDLLHEVFKKYKKIITIEDGVVSGGLGSAILEFKSDHAYTSIVKRMGIPDRFIEQGTIQELHHECGYDVEGIIAAIKEISSI